MKRRDFIAADGIMSVLDYHSRQQLRETVVKFRQLAVIAACIVAGTTCDIAMAAPSCSPWLDQGNGTSWRECVNDDGTTHCYVISNQPGSVAQEVRCK